MLPSFTPSRSQVKLSENMCINCSQTTTGQVALAGPGTLVTLVVANSKRFSKVLLDFLVDSRLSNLEATSSISAS